MKKIIALATLVILALCVTGCVPEEYYRYKEMRLLQLPADEFLKEMRADTERMAALNGDSYCKTCDKAIEGKVRICSYCGKYL